MPKPFHEIISRDEFPEDYWHSVDYLSVEYIFTYEGESRVAFNIKTRLGDEDEWKGNDDHKITPKYAVYRFSMEPSRWDNRGCLNYERQSNVIGHKPKNKNDRVPDFTPVAQDSVAEFYLDLRRFEPYSEHMKLTNTGIIGDHLYRWLSFRSLGTSMGPFRFHESKTNPYNYYDSRDFICQVFAKLCAGGYIESPVILKARPVGVQQKLEPPHQQDSEDYRFTFSKVISNLIFAQGEPEYAHDYPLGSEQRKQGIFQKDDILGVYKPIIKGTFDTRRYERQEVIRVEFEKFREREKICFPYNEDTTLIDQEIKTCGTKVYKELKLKTRLYQDPPAAEATKTHETSTTGPQRRTVRRQVGDAVSTSSQPATTTQGEQVPAKRRTRQTSVAVSRVDANDGAPPRRRQTKPPLLGKQTLSPTPPPTEARRGTKSASRAMSPTAVVSADSTKELAQKATRTRASDVIPELAKDATSQTVGSNNSQPTKGAVATEVVNPQKKTNKASTR